MEKLKQHQELLERSLAHVELYRKSISQEEFELAWEHQNDLMKIIWRCKNQLVKMNLKRKRT